MARGCRRVKQVSRDQLAVSHLTAEAMKTANE